MNGYILRSILNYLKEKPQINYSKIDNQQNRLFIAGEIQGSTIGYFYYKSNSTIHFILKLSTFIDYGFYDYPHIYSIVLNNQIINHDHLNNQEFDEIINMNDQIQEILESNFIKSNILKFLEKHLEII